MSTPAPEPLFGFAESLPGQLHLPTDPERTRMPATPDPARLEVAPAGAPLTDDELALAAGEVACRHYGYRPQRATLDPRGGNVYVGSDYVGTLVGTVLRLDRNPGERVAIDLELVEREVL